jgi:hypothetical protein
MKQLTLASLVGLAVLAGVPGELPQARAAHYRAYYSARMHGNGYTYRRYYYYSKTYHQYRQHVAVYHPAQPRYVYYYNPYKGRYWGRYDCVSGGYSLLKECDQKPTLGEIPDSAFPKPGPMPPAEPGDDEAMLPPPEAGSGQAPTMPPSTGGCPSKT